MSGVDFSRYKRLVQGIFNPEPKNDNGPEDPIWCLGSRYEQDRPGGRQDGLGPIDSGTEDMAASNVYHDVQEEQPNRSKGMVNGAGSRAEKTSATVTDTDQGWPVGFLDDSESRMWLTYRSNFPPIMKSSEASMTLSVRLRSLTDKEGFTSDTGWGCMIRSGQCLLANALSVLRLGREWRRSCKQQEEQQLLSLFADDPRAPFSIHKFVEHGAQACGKHPGEWFGPSAAARCIEALSDDCETAGLRVYMNGDGADVYEDKLLKIAKSKQDTFTPVLILLGVRLGIDRVTPAYWDALKETLEFPQSVGIAGGRPSSSHYFFAHQRDQFFYLDPHFTRPALPFHRDPADYTVEEINSCHTRRLRRLGITDMDPSMLLAFLIRDEKDWKDWRESVENSRSKPVIHIANSEPRTHAGGFERQTAVDEVESFDEDDEADAVDLSRS